MPMRDGIRHMTAALQRRCRKRIAFGFALALFAAPALAQLPAWKAQHPERPGTLLLLGSIHLLRAADHPLPDVVDQFYSLSDSIVFELDLDDLAATDVQSRFMGAALLPAESSLEHMLGPTLYAETAAAARTYGIDVRLFSRFEPWFVATMLMSFGLSNLGYEAQFGVEQYLLGKARSDGKDVLGVEALDDQVAVFDLLSDDDQMAFLEQTLAELQRDSESMTSLVSAWRSGELESLESDLMRDFGQFPGLYERLVVDRNTTWVETLEEFSSQNTVYGVVVGALHLVGDNSVLEMLRDRGFTISPLQ
jgi:uncharacterized protein YbaP (TraB family)